MIGETIGAYRIVAKLGEGGMGVVWIGEHTVIGRRAAIKVLHAHYSIHAELTARFVNEARAAALLSHPAIVEVYDFGEHAGRAFLVMELLEGESLAARLGRGALARPYALEVVRAIAVALQAAHDKGIVHRDLKPDNVFLGDVVKILDFGIAKLGGDHRDAGLTAAGSIIGTPAYMSPEQCRGAGGVDARSDIYSLGCMLFELLTGAPPFSGDGAGDVMAAHLREPPPRLASIDPSSPPILDGLVTRMLAKAPGDRPAAMRDVVAELDCATAACGAETFVIVPVSPGLLADPRVTTLGAAASEVSRPIRRVGPRSGWPLLGLALACGAALALWPRRETPTVSPPPIAVGAPRLELPPLPPIAVAPPRSEPPAPIIVIPALAPVAPLAPDEVARAAGAACVAELPRPRRRHHQVLKDGIYDAFGDP